MQTLLNYAAPSEELILILDEFGGKGYNIAYALEDGHTWIKKAYVTLSEMLVQRNVSDLTDNAAYTVMPIKIGNSDKPTNAFITRDNQVVKEIAFKLTNAERFKLFSHMSVHLDK